MISLKGNINSGVVYTESESSFENEYQFPIDIDNEEFKFDRKVPHEIRTVIFKYIRYRRLGGLVKTVFKVRFEGFTKENFIYD